ncbi:Tn3 family transposase [Streptomyces sp. NRRL F-4474]|uniref:Tn3 family transposase n=1 Tax=Streptomyces sp. NRRL F-4474 TaxID=1463851 RepID=UPI000A9E592C
MAVQSARHRIRDTRSRCGPASADRTDPDRHPSARWRNGPPPPRPRAGPVAHGQSEIGFGITRSLNFDLLPRIKRIKRINKVKPHRHVAGEPYAYPQPTPALTHPTRPTRWGPIARQYDQTIKYATAIRTRTAATEAILRRFTRNASHPTPATPPTRGRWRSVARSRPGCTGVRLAWHCLPTPHRYDSRYRRV